MQQPPYMPPGAPPPGYGPPPPMGGMPMGGPPGAMPPMGDPMRAQGQVAGPAIGLLVVGIFMILSQIAGILFNLLGAGMGAVGAVGGSDDAIASLFSGVIGLVFSAVWMVFGGVVIFGALKMKALQSYGLAMTAAIVAMLPCTSGWCCLLGLPLGIWALVVLMNNDVKAAFR